MTGTAKVRLRPLREPDLDQLEVVFADPELSGEFTWYGFGSVAALRRRLAEDGGIGVTSGYLAIEESGDWCGYLTWYAQFYGGAAGSQSWRFDMALLPTARGRGVGTAATRAVTAYLFDNTPVQRIECCVDPDNTPSIAMLERAGYEREGRLRRVEFRAGQWHDLLMYSRLREPE